MTALGSRGEAALEDWLRVRYFDARVDISSSGVEPYDLREVRRLTGMTVDDLDDLVLRDSPSQGQERLREAVAKRFLPGPAHEPFVTNGSTEAILLAMSALVGPGDQVVVTSASYHALTSQAIACGAELVHWELDLAGARPDLDRLRDLVGPRTRAVVVNFPHNPSGITLTAREYDEFLSIVGDSGAYLLWDAAFAEVSHDGAPLEDPSRSLERCVSFGTLSKAYGLPGLRVGWCITPSSLVPRLITLRDHVTLSTSPLVEEIAARVLENADAVLAPRLEQARANREVVRRWLDDHGDLIAGPMPGGGVTFFPKLLGVDDARPVCELLLDRHGVLTVPGDCFDRPDRVRIGYGGPGDELEEGLTVLADVLAGWSQR